MLTWRRMVTAGAGSTGKSTSRQGGGRGRGEAFEMEEAVAVVNKQLELYNARSLDQLMDLMADDIVVSDGESGAVTAMSKAHLRTRYEERFKTPVHAELLGRLCCGLTVVDREVITGLPNDGVDDCMATYVVHGGKIASITFVWRPRTTT